MENVEWGFLLSQGLCEIWAEHVCALFLLESMLRFGFINKCDFIWVALQRAAVASLLMSTIPPSDTQRFEFDSWKNVHTIQKNGC